MMKRIFTIAFVLTGLMSGLCKPLQAQDSLPAIKTWRIGIFAPVYLDSVMKNGVFPYDKTFPRFVLPGLDFIQGAQVALDSMPIYQSRIDARIYDSKSKTEPVSELISQQKLDSLDLIIGSVKDEEYLQLAAFAKQKRIPFVSATYPNDGGVTDNDYLLILNSTLKAHCEAIFGYLLQNHGTDNVLLARQSGTQEDKVEGYFTQLNSPDEWELMKIRRFQTDSNFAALKFQLDSTKDNIIIGGSLDENFASALAHASASLSKKYRIKLIGMPNWELFGSFMNPKKASLGEFPIYYTSPYFHLKQDMNSRILQDVYLKKYKGKPSDHAYKGFETVYLFSKLLSMYGKNMMNHLNDYPYKIFTEYRFRPVINDKKSRIIDYYENKQLYFLKIQQQQISKAW